MQTQAYSNMNEVVHWVTITVKDRPGGEVIEFLTWSGLKWELRLRYDWYFRYRAALAQVKHPKFEVEFRWGHEPATGKTLVEIQKAKTSAKRGLLSKYENLLMKAEQNWDQLFPIQEDEIYKRAAAKVERLKKELHGQNT